MIGITSQRFPSGTTPIDSSIPSDTKLAYPPEFSDLPQTAAGAAANQAIERTKASSISGS